ncbi:myrosinase 1-like isoform X1 [Agrilus planipennis]|uniref:Myrosinase 1-like isoform X1 n=1 Tax=Agrilus planipennis TaxID=224129 RepID=A0A7F5R4D9_AGRPL|nr:myrosinase 1-like isoform X1 [Agrilus planipennis]
MLPSFNMEVNNNAMFSKIITLFCLIAYRECASNYTFPSDFLFGTGTSSYQVEGAWNESGKGENIWDFITHNTPEFVDDRTNGDIACDSYHKYEEDLALAKDLGVNFYRFSVSWARIYPNGYPYNPNQEGIAYYNNLIDAILAQNMTPMLTIYHWDLPQRLQELGGWTNPLIVQLYTEYARTLLENFSDRIKYWVTFNEPYMACNAGYGEVGYAPALGMSGIADYLCAHNLLKSHAAVYHLFNDTYRTRNNATMGITLNSIWIDPGSPEEEEAAERTRQFQVGLYANPIFSANGDYPEVMKEYIGNRSVAQGYSKSRLPQFTSDEIEFIKGTFDFLGMNHYTTRLARNSPPTNNMVSFNSDMQTEMWVNSSWPGGREPIVPSGFRKLLTWIKNTYNNPIVYITENGYGDNGELDDYVRVSYYGSYLEALLEAINEDNVNVRGYSAWSLMDNFEWKSGYTWRYGIYSVNFTDPNRPRTAKLSATFYKNVIANRAVGDYPSLS